MISKVYLVFNRTHSILKGGHPFVSFILMVLFSMKRLLWRITEDQRDFIEMALEEDHHP